MQVRIATWPECHDTGPFAGDGACLMRTFPVFDRAEGAECDSPSPRADAGGRGTEQVGTSTAAVHYLSRGIQTDQDETVCLG